MQSAVGHLGFPLDAAAVFVLVVATSVWMDLRLHKGSETISIRNAVVWSLIWIGIGCGFGLFVRQRFGPSYMSDYFAGYALEKALSIDNLMVFIAVFSYFKINGALQHRILYYGILGALVFRGIFALGGTALLALGPGVELIFGLIVLLSAVQLLRGGDDASEEDYSEHKVVRMARRFLPVFHRLDGNRFVIPKLRAEAIIAEHPPSEPLNRPLGTVSHWVSPALVCLAVIEVSDLMFAFDSVPAVIAVTREPVLVYAAMIFAILGLRSLYFVLAALAESLVHLEKAVFCLLFFIGGKLWLSASDDIWAWFSDWGAGSPPWTSITALSGGDRSLPAFGIFVSVIALGVLLVAPALGCGAALLLQVLWNRLFPSAQRSSWRTARAAWVNGSLWLCLRIPLVALFVHATATVRHAEEIHVSPTWNLIIVLGILAAGVIASLVFPASRELSPKTSEPAAKATSDRAELPVSERLDLGK